MRARLLAVFAVSFFSAAVAQTSKPAEDPGAAFSKAASLYYIPTDHGLNSFHCDVELDWKKLLEDTGAGKLTDDNPVLAYLRTVHLAVEDRPKDAGELLWNSEKAPDPTLAHAEKMIHEGFKQSWTGFFQIWNQFATGWMVRITDEHTNVERTAEGGFRVFTEDPQGPQNEAEEHYNSALLLQSFNVKTPDLEVHMKPSFAPSPDGLLVTRLDSTYKTGTATTESRVAMDIAYARVEGFQLPSALDIDANGARLHFGLRKCTVKAGGATK